MFAKPNAETIESVVEELSLTDESEYVTAYQVVKLVNEWLESEDVDPMNPQELYNKIRDGKVACIVEVNGANRIHRDDVQNLATEWFVRKLHASKK